MSTQVKIQVPIDKDVRDGLEKRAQALGFDSIQAYIRFWAKAEVDGRRVDFNGGAVMLTPRANARYERMAAELDAQKASGQAKVYNSVGDFMKDL